MSNPETSFPAADGEAYGTAIDYGVDMAQLEFLLGLTPEERLLRHEKARVLVLAARKAGIDYYGFDPRPAQAP